MDIKNLPLVVAALSERRTAVPDRCYNQTADWTHLPQVSKASAGSNQLAERLWEFLHPLAEMSNEPEELPPRRNYLAPPSVPCVAPTWTFYHDKPVGYPISVNLLNGLIKS